MDVAGDPDGQQIRKAVDAALEEFFDAREAASADLPEVAMFTGLLRSLLRAGGKRLRPMLCVAGWQAVTGEAPPDRLLRLAASLELFHLFALVHDDLMDGSESRHGQPTAHRELAERFADHPRGTALGRDSAILLGDLALSWAAQLAYTGAGLMPTELAVAGPLLGALHTETIVGQHLDLAITGVAGTDPEPAWRVMRYKTAKYTIERPLQIGAAVAGAGPRLMEALSAYAVPLGEAFQMRDDVLGVFGDPDRTGKSALEDLREGKYTVLTALARQRADAGQTAVLDASLGDPELDEAGAVALRGILTATGAVSTVEDLIAARYSAAVAALDSAPMRESARERLRALADTAARRAA